jgi:hypothetical protein
MYKVVYYPTASETVLAFKWFETFKEATEFSLKLRTDVLEIKWYESEELVRK